MTYFTLGFSGASYAAGVGVLGETGMRAIDGHGKHHQRSVALTVAILIAAAWLALSLSSLQRTSTHHGPLPAPPPSLFGR